MGLAVLIDIIAIATCIAIILVTTDYGARNAAEHGAGYRTDTGADAGNDRTSDRARACPEGCPGSLAGDHMIVRRIGCTAA
jgi:hypothetical protein